MKLNKLSLARSLLYKKIDSLLNDPRCTDTTQRTFLMNLRSALAECTRYEELEHCFNAFCDGFDAVSADPSELDPDDDDDFDE